MLAAKGLKGGLCEDRPGLCGAKDRQIQPRPAELRARASPSAERVPLWAHCVKRAAHVDPSQQDNVQPEIMYFFFLFALPMLNVYHQKI